MRNCAHYFLFFARFCPFAFALGLRFFLRAFFKMRPLADLLFFFSLRVFAALRVDFAGRFAFFGPAITETRRISVIAVPGAPGSSKDEVLKSIVSEAMGAPFGNVTIACCSRCHIWAPGKP